MYFKLIQYSFTFFKHQLRLAYLLHLSYTEYKQAVRAIYGVTDSGSETLGPPINKSVA